MKDQAIKMSAFYQHFLSNPITASAVGWIFKFQMHQLLKDGCTIQLFPILGHHVPKNIIYESKAPPATRATLYSTIWIAWLDLVGLVLKMTLTAGNYYHFSNVNFTAFDSILHWSLRQILTNPPCQSCWYFRWCETRIHIMSDSMVFLQLRNWTYL